jgi:hypothetical protein
VICGKCGAKNEDYARYCWNCGTPTHVSKIQGQNVLRFLNREWLGFTQVLPWLLYLGALCVLVFQLYVAIDSLISNPYYISAFSYRSFIEDLAHGVFWSGILIGLAGIVSTQKDNRQARRLRNGLYLAAGALLCTSIVTMILHMFTNTLSSTDSVSIAERIYWALSSFLYIGLFEGGILAGLGALNSPRHKHETQDYDQTINILYLAAAATIIIGIITATLSVTYYDYAETYWFFYRFAFYGIFCSGILAALGRLVALRNRNRNEPDLEDEELEEEDAAMDGPTTP